LLLKMQGISAATRNRWLRQVHHHVAIDQIQQRTAIQSAIGNSAGQSKPKTKSKEKWQAHG
jgi:hypothetical protein